MRWENGCLLNKDELLKVEASGVGDRPAWPLFTSLWQWWLWRMLYCSEYRREDLSSSRPAMYINSLPVGQHLSGWKTEVWTHHNQPYALTHAVKSRQFYLHFRKQTGTKKKINKRLGNLKRFILHFSFKCRSSVIHLYKYFFLVIVVDLPSRNVKTSSI